MPQKKIRPNEHPRDAGRLEKTIYTAEYSTLLRLLREARESSEMTQVELAEVLGQTQSFVSKIERGDRRLDIIQLRTILKHLKITLPQFVADLEVQLVKRP